MTTHYRIACALIIRDGHIAMVQQTFDGITAWSLPGGGCEGDEDFITAARREAREETGLILDGDAVHACTCVYSNAIDNSVCHVETYVFTDSRGDIAPADPDQSIEQAAWVPRDEVLKRLQNLPWPMMGKPAAAWLLAANPVPQHWEFAIDAQKKSRHLSTRPATPKP